MTYVSVMVVFSVELTKQNVIKMKEDTSSNADFGFCSIVESVASLKSSDTLGEKETGVPPDEG